MCHLWTVVSGAVSFGVFAGLLSGILYVVLVASRWVGKLRVTLEEEAIKREREEVLLSHYSCLQCGIRSHTEIDRASSVEICENCSRDLRGHLASSTLLRSNARRRTKSYEEKDKLVSPEIKDVNDAKTARIRENIEKLMEKMVGDSLDGVSVGKLSNHPAYLGIFARYHDSLCRGLARLGFALHTSILNGNEIDLESPRDAQTALRLLIEKIVSEAMKLPKVDEIYHSRTSTEEGYYEDGYVDKSYEDILATAILNKVIEQCQGQENRSKSKKCKESVFKSMKNKSVYDKVDENEKFREDDALSDWSDASKSEQLSLTIEEHIEEITTAYENSDEESTETKDVFPFTESGRIACDEVVHDHEHSDAESEERNSVTELMMSGNSWEENWLFQRKKLRPRPSAHHPVPVPMLVPNPSQDFRALIGGVDADDLSDMSDCSDSVLEDVVLACEKEADNMDADNSSENENGSAIITNSVKDDDDEKATTLMKMEKNVTDLLKFPKSVHSSFPSLSQKEKDVSVDYECFQETDVELPNPSRNSADVFDSEEKIEKNKPLKCRIAEREKEKWNHPVAMDDNPYSAENISKRLQRFKKEYFRTGYYSEDSIDFPGDSLEEITNEPIDYAKYSRDYYVKASRWPTGDPNVRNTAAIHACRGESFESFRKSTQDNLENYSTDVSKLAREASSFSGDKRLITYWAEKSVKETSSNINIMLPNVKELTRKFSMGMKELHHKSEMSVASQEEHRQIVTQKQSNSIMTEEDETKDSIDDTSTKESLQSSNETSCGRCGDPACEELTKGEEVTKASSLPFSKFNGKEVHSLTARSISKEFRDELKNNASRKALPKMDPNRSKQGIPVDIVSEGMRTRTPTPPIDLQSKRKFWENIISNAQK